MGCGFGAGVGVGAGGDEGVFEDLCRVELG